MKHYQNLGVSKNASPEEIKQAYRKRAQETHPDKGGNAEDFADVAAAYEVLSDPKRKLLYDGTGQDRQKPLEAEVQRLLVQMFNDVLLLDHDVDVLDGMHELLNTGLRRFSDQLEKCKARKKRLETRRLNIKSKGRVNLAHLVIDGALEPLKQEIAVIEREIKIGKAASKELKTYSETKVQGPKNSSISQFFEVRYGFEPTPFGGFR